MRKALLAIALVTSPLAAQAWGPDGHKTVATLAARLIEGTPAEARVAALLGDIPLPLASLWADCVKGISPSLGYAYPAPGKYPDCGPLETPERMAEMADYVRRNDRQCEIGPDEDACHKQAHYADVALQRGRYRLGFIGTRPDDVVGALRTAILVLQGKPAAGPPHFASQREALLVLVHLVGDIHQPLHVSSVYLDEQGRRVDPDKTGRALESFTVGGNSLYVAGSTGSSPLKLHQLWDAVPYQLKPSHVNAAWLAEARKVRPDAGDPANWPARWATQSVEQAELAFEGLNFSAREDTHWNASLPAGYRERADAIKRQQLTRAGARLAQLLKTLFAQ
jgi:hypothetical protein